MEKYIVVDRIENGVAACEMPGRVMQMLPLSLLPEGVKEGDVLLQEKGGSYIIDHMETQRRRQANLELLKRLR